MHKALPVIEFRALDISDPCLVRIGLGDLLDYFQLSLVVAHADKPHVPVFLCTRQAITALRWMAITAREAHGGGAPRAIWMSRASSVVPERWAASSHANAATFSTKSSATSCSTCERAHTRGESRKTPRVRRTTTHLLRLRLQSQLRVDCVRELLQPGRREEIAPVHRAPTQESRARTRSPSKNSTVYDRYSRTRTALLVQAASSVWTVRLSLCLDS